MTLKISKILINLGMSISVLISLILIFLGTNVLGANSTSVRALFLIALLLYLIRYFYLINYVKQNKTTFQLIGKMKYPILKDTVACLFLFCLMPIGFTIAHIKFNKTLDWIDILAFTLYILGTLLTLISEKQRKNWKSINKNQLYKEGLFKYANHINYFGETLSFPSLCLIATGSYWIFILALIHQIFDFILIQIPKQEKYMKIKYQNDFKKIETRKKLIPFVF